MPKKNIELLKRLRTRFLRMRHRKHFDMRPIAMKTECGTAMCIAGHTLDLAGYKMRRNHDSHHMLGTFSGRCDFDFIAPDGSMVREPLYAARDELGLDKNVAHALFHDFSLMTPKQAARRIDALISDNAPAR